MDSEGALQPVTLGRNLSRRQKPIGWMPQDRWAKIALLVSLVQCLLASAIELYIAVTHRNYVDSLKGQISSSVEGIGVALIAYHALFIASQFFQLILLFDALMQLSLIQLITTTLFNWAIWGYSIIQMVQAGSWIPDNVARGITVLHPTKNAEMALIAVLLVFCLGWVFLTWKLYFVFGWTTYKEMGADVEVRNVLYLYHIYILLLKVDVFFFLGFSLQFAWLVLLNGNNSTPFITHLLISVPGTIVILSLAYYAVRRENKTLVYLTLVALFTGAGYLIAKIYDIWYAKDDRFGSSRNSLTLFIVITLLMIFATATAAVLNMRKFGQGLMDKLDNASSVGGDRGEMYAFESRRR